MNIMIATPPQQNVRVVQRIWNVQRDSRRGILGIVLGYTMSFGLSMLIGMLFRISSATKAANFALIGALRYE